MQGKLLGISNEIGLDWKEEDANMRENIPWSLQQRRLTTGTRLQVSATAAIIRTGR